MRPSAATHSVPASIGDYAIVGDGRACALISRNGGIDWLCLPSPSAPSVFGRLLDDANGGSCSVAPPAYHSVRRAYLPGTPILQTVFETDTGTLSVTDFLPVGNDVMHLRPMRELIRIVECTAGEAQARVRIDPRPDYARRRVVPRRRGAQHWLYAWGNKTLAVASDVPLALQDTALAGTATLKAGERYSLSLAFGEGEIAILPPLNGHIARRRAETERWWHGWSTSCNYHGPYRDILCRSAMTLKLLSVCLSGAILAAATTSLPEVPGGVRNWDYRYCWLRDAGLTMRALVGLGYMDEGRAFLSWLLHATRMTWPHLDVMYDLYGRSEIPETTLAHLAGYGGATPVRIGNAAAKQLQLDIYGEVILAADSFCAAGGELDSVEQRLLIGLGRVIATEWTHPDNGIWELRTELRRHVFSTALGWIGLDRLLKLHAAGTLDLGRDAATFAAEREKIAAAIEDRGFNTALGSYVSEFDGDTPDASLLLLGCIGFKAPHDSRMMSTYRHLRKTLGRGALLYRYPPAGDGLPGREGAFGVCGYWGVELLAQAGEVEEARGLYEELLGYGNDVGLFAEEFDPDSGLPLGNFPQAFTHVGLINAGLALQRAGGTQ